MDLKARSATCELVLRVPGSSAGLERAISLEGVRGIGDSTISVRSKMECSWENFKRAGSVEFILLATAARKERAQSGPARRPGRRSDVPRGYDRGEIRPVSESRPCCPLPGIVGVR